jgi:hypothetical protein
MTTTALTRRLSADAWQHLLAGHIYDYGRHHGLWLVHETPVPVACGVAPFTAEDEPIGDDKAFQTYLSSLPAHGQPVVVYGPMPAGIKGSVAKKATQRMTPQGTSRAPHRKVYVYDEFATHNTHTQQTGATHMSTTTKAKAIDEFVTVIDVTPKPKRGDNLRKPKRPAVTVLPTEVTDFLANLVHEPKKVFATAAASHIFLGADAPTSTGASYETKALKRLERIKADLAKVAA